MKNFKYLIYTFSFFLGATNLYSKECSALLKKGSGDVFLSFKGSSSSSQSKACKRAMRKCHKELEYRQSCDELPYGYCQIENRRNRRKYYSCSYELFSKNHRLLEKFTSSTNNQQEACNLAKNKCYDDLNYRQSRGQNIYAYCQKASGGGRGDDDDRDDDRDDQVITKYCYVDRLDIYHYLIQSYYGYATGRADSNLKRKACNYAINLCRRHIWGQQRCLIRAY